MTELDNQLGAIDLTRTLAEQEAIQAFLAPSFSENILVVPNELLFRLLLIAKELISQNLQTVGMGLLRLELYGIRLGYRRKVITPLVDGSNKVDRAESQFVSDEQWETFGEKKISNEESIQKLLSDTAEKVTEELQRIYPNINVNAEWDVYLSAIIVDSSTNSTESALPTFQASACGKCDNGTGLIDGNKIGDRCVPCTPNA